MITEIDEPISVGVLFKKGRVMPKWFIWNNRKYNVQEITYSWEDHDGDAKLFIFSVTDGTNLFELSLNTKAMNWRLNKIYCDG